MQPDNNTIAPGAAPAPEPAPASTPEPAPAPAPAPVSEPTSNPGLGPVLPMTPNNAPLASPAPAAEKKGKGKLFVIIGIVVVVILVAVVAAVLLMTQGKSAVSIEKIRDYCKKNDLSMVEAPEDQDSVVEGIVCSEKIDYSSDLYTHNKDVYSIQYIAFDKPVLEMEEFKDSMGDLLSLVDPLVDSGNYKKIYVQMGETEVEYLIIDKNTYISVIASNNDAAKKFLIDLGYPDDKWGTVQEYGGGFGTDSYDTDSYDIDSYEEAASGLQSTKNDTQRRNDVARVDTSIIQYQTNNQGKLPEAGKWTGTASFDDCGSNSACNFAQKYMNSSFEPTRNDFKDPDGTYYNVEIGSGAFEYNKSGMDYTMYIRTEAECDGEAAIPSGEGHFAIVYRLENAGVYCLDDQ